jgi:hypothetical protein
VGFLAVFQEGLVLVHKLLNLGLHMLVPHHLVAGHLPYPDDFLHHHLHQLLLRNHLPQLATQKEVEEDDLNKWRQSAFPKDIN